MSSLYAVGSGLDIPTIVSQLVTAERAPAENRINNQGVAINAKLSALGTIKSALGNVQSSLKTVTEAISTPSWKTTVAEGAGFTASTTSSATGGSYQIEVKQLATAQKLASAAFQADEKVGAGTLALAIDDRTWDIEVADDMNLAALARQINRVVDGKGVTASVITSDEGQHLVLTATTPGSKGQITLTATPAAADPDAPVDPEAPTPAASRLHLLAYDGSAASNPMTQVTAASDAIVLIDGKTRTGSTNTFTDLIEGVTINLTKAEEGKSFNLAVAADSTAAKTGLSAFVSTYNAALGTLKSASNYNSETKTASALTGDAMVRGLQAQLRAIFGGDNVSDLKALGISIAKDGTLSFDSAAYEKTRAEQPSLADSVLGKTGRLSTRLEGLLKNNLDSGTGLLTQRVDTLNQQIKKLEKEFDDLDARMEKVYQRYTAQFTAMDSLVAQMQSTSNYLTQQLANLSSSNSKK